MDWMGQTWELIFAESSFQGEAPAALFRGYVFRPQNSGGYGFSREKAHNSQKESPRPNNRSLSANPQQ